MNRELLQLARLYHIQTSYIDMAKQRHEADPQSLLLVLRAMGAGVEQFDDVGRALARRTEELRQRTVQPVMVAWDGDVDGRHFDFGYHDDEVKGQKTFIISAPKKAYFPLTPSTAASTDNYQQSVVRKPPLADRRPTLTQGLWGLFTPIYALHSRRNPNAGDLTDFENFIAWMGDLGGSVAATLPLLAAFLDEPFEPSPYAPASRLFWNEFYVDVLRVPEFVANAEAKRLFEQRPKKTRLVDYRSEMAYKRRILEELSRTFFSEAKPERLQAFGKFIREHKGIEDYARFRAVTDRLRSGWNAWPSRLRNGTIRKHDYDEDTKNYYLYSQWVVQEQLQSLADKSALGGQFLYLDLPLGLHPDSYDVWRNRDAFVPDVGGGAPPDPVFTKGQNWGFPPMHPEVMRLNRYQYVIAYIRNHFRFARLLRIDHVMGLHRLYWIPGELTGDKGVYVEYPAEELYAILSLESHRHSAGIVGENLGTVPPEVNAAMARHDIRKMYVVQYEIMGDPKKPSLPEVPKKCVASINTHDMPPFRAFWEGEDIRDRLDLNFQDSKGAQAERRNRETIRKALAKFLRRSSQQSASGGQNQKGLSGSLDPAAVFRATTQYLANSVADVVLVNVEDLWGEVLPQNVPATSKERPNWRRRLRPGNEQIRRMAEVVEVLSHVFNHRSRSLPV